MARHMDIAEIGGESPDPALAAAWAAWVHSLERGGPTAGSVETQALVRALRSTVAVNDDIREFYIRVIESGVRTILAVPLLREGTAIGTIAIRRLVMRPFTEKQVALVKTFADQAVIAIENVRLFTELQSRNRELSETLEQQTTTSDVLRVISRSPTDLAPVLAAVATSAARLCQAVDVLILGVDGDALRILSGRGPFSGVVPLGERIPIDRGSVVGRAVVDRRAVHVTDLAAESDEEFPAGKALQRRFGHHTMLATPLLREGLPIGVIAVFRSEVRPFTEKQVALLQTFADQAVIAIENVRLFTELQARNRDLTEALEQQTATGEILRVISGSPTDVQPVFDTIARSARALCDGVFSAVYRLAGELVHLVAHDNFTPAGLEAARRLYPRPVSDTFSTGRAILQRTVDHVPDVELLPHRPSLSPSLRFRSQLSVPMLREGVALGAIAVSRLDPGPFSDAQISLLRTFADQAVIAIENVRLFQELQARNRDLGESLEQQTATSEILRVISHSQTDVQPVFDTIADNLLRLFDAWDAWVSRYEGGLIHIAAVRAGRPEAAPSRPSEPFSPTPELTVGRCVLAGSVIHVADVETDPGVSARSREVAATYGWRSALAAPMLRVGQVIGVVMVTRKEAGGFTEREVGLLRTFADQAVIAIENVRLFRELRERTDELTRSVEELRALGEVGRAVGSTLDLETVLGTIVSRASQLSGGDGGAIYEYDETARLFRLRGADSLEEELLEALRAAPVRFGEGAMGRAAAERMPVQIADVLVPGAYEGRFRGLLERAGFRGLLAIPLLREETVVGALIVRRREPGLFPEATVSLLQTFAAQSVLAIQNARLYRELEEKGRELAEASRHKGQFLANMSHELRTPLNAILGYTELILDQIYGEVPDRIREVMDRIDRSGRHLLGLINDVLDLSKIEAGQLTLGLADYSLQEVVHAVVTQVEALAAEKGLALRVTVASELPAGRGDERRLTQVLLNLVGNAIKFTEAGEVGIDASVRDGAFVVAVRDTGLGIAPADQAKIFEEFQQADSSSTRKKGGTGLGLSIARRIVALHGGRLTVESTPGAGATFTFTVPVRVERQVAP